MLPSKLQKILFSLPSSIQKLIEPILHFLESIISQQHQKISDLENKIRTLELQLLDRTKNSQNSSKPPSTDSPYEKPAPKSRREDNGRKPGGQKNHEGNTLEMVTNPTHTIRYSVSTCGKCGLDLTTIPIKGVISRQSYDIPPLEIEVTEHQVEVKKCNCGHCNQADFPIWVNRYVQYGPNIKGLLVYLQNYQLLPYERTKEMIKDLFNHNISGGTIYNSNKTAYENLENFEIDLKQVLCTALIAGFDETGFRVLSKLWWLHSCSTNEYAYYEVHEKRGNEAMDDIGILPKYQGIAIHDFWKSYLKYSCTHGLCNAHLIRELTFIHEKLDEEWASELIELLLEMKQAKEDAIAQNQQSINKEVLEQFQQKYDLIIQQGFEQNPFIPPKPPPKGQKKKPGRPKKTKQRNLLERLRDYKTDIIRFLFDLAVPFDNNFSERDIRMMKLKQKISGCFRSKQGAQIFARVRSFIVTARKQKRRVLQVLVNIFMDNSIWEEMVNFSYAE